MQGHQYWWLAGGYDLEIGHFQKWLAWWLPGGWWLFCAVIQATTSCVHYRPLSPPHLYSPLSFSFFSLTASLNSKNPQHAWYIMRRRNFKKTSHYINLHAFTAFPFHLPIFIFTFPLRAFHSLSSFHLPHLSTTRSSSTHGTICPSYDTGTWTARCW